MLRWIVFLLVAAGCSPPLVDGAYRCDDDRCPRGWICGADRVCRTTALDAGPGGPDVPGMPDGPLGRGPAEPCMRDVDCLSGVCFRGELGDVWTNGYCSEPCSAVDDPRCNVLGTFSGCLDTRCELLCDLGGECPTDFACVGVYWDAEGALGSCYPPGAPIDPGGRACATTDECPLGMDCIGLMVGPMVCARPCAPGYTCAPSETCRSTPRSGMRCLP